MEMIIMQIPGIKVKIIPLPIAMVAKAALEKFGDVRAYSKV